MLTGSWEYSVHTEIATWTETAAQLLGLSPDQTTTGLLSTLLQNLPNPVLQELVAFMGQPQKNAASREPVKIQSGWTDAAGHRHLIWIGAEAIGNDGRFLGYVRPSVRTFLPAEGRTLELQPDRAYSVTVHDEAGEILHQSELQATGSAPGSLVATVFGPIPVDHEPSSSRFVVVEDVSARDAALLELERGEARYRMLADNVPQLVWLARPGGQVVYCNQKTLDYMGAPIEELSRTGWSQGAHPDDVRRVVRSWRKSVTRSVPLEEEFRIRRASDGEYRWHLVRAVPTGDGTWFGTSTDIHDARMQQERFRLQFDLSEASPDIIATLTPEGKVIYLNPAGRAFFNLQDGRDPGTLEIRKAYSEGSWAQLQHEILPSVLAGGIFKGETTLRILDGSDVPISLVVVGHTNAEGVLTQISGIARDISAQYSAAKELAQNREVIDHIADSIPDLLYIYDYQAGKNLFASRSIESKLGVTVAEAQNWDLRENVHPDDFPEVLAHVNRLQGCEESEFSEVDYRVRHKNGEYRWFRSRDVVFRRAADNSVWQVLGIATDITDRKANETNLQLLAEKLKASNQELEAARDEALLAVRSKTQFFANISHELRTPLNAVIGLTSSLLGRELDDDVREDLEIVQSSGGSLLRIINDILDISKSESGKLAVENSVTDLRAMVSDVTALYRMNAQDRNLFLEVDFEGPNEPVLADPTRIKQIVGNLVSNALKFTSEGGVEVRLITTLIGEQMSVEVNVADTGIGIAEDKQELIFEAFQQADSSTFRRYGGTGLGLSISRKLAEIMGGSLTISSEAGIGSTFTLSLTLDLAQPEEHAPTNAQIDEFFPSSILLAEDNAVNVVVAMKMLKQYGCDVTVVGNGYAAISKAMEGGFDLVLMDLQMPMCDGLEACVAIRYHEEMNGGHVPIVALTANAMAEDIEACQLAGMDGFLSKPFTSSGLRATLAKYGKRSKISV